MKIIDAHNHPDWLAHDLERVLENMDVSGIARTWLLSWECPAGEVTAGAGSFPGVVLGGSAGPIPFTRCISYLERAPERFIIGYCPDPRRPDACAALRAARRIYGARVCGELKCRMMYDNPDALRLFRLAGELGMPVVFHLEYDLRSTPDGHRAEWWGGTIETIERVLAACPETVFIGHGPGFWIHVSGDELWRTTNYAPPAARVVPGGRVPALLRKHPNLMADLSANSGQRALGRDPEHARVFLEEFQDRILFARDCFEDGHRQLIDSLDLPETVLEKIYRRNAEKMPADPLSADRK